jgi:aspartyl-tRNA synthetase
MAKLKADREEKKKQKEEAKANKKGKAERMQEAQSKTKEVKDVGADPYAANYGVFPMNRSQCDPEDRFSKKYNEITNLDAKMEGQTVRIRGRAQNIRAQGKSCFIVMREIYATVQCIIFEQTTSK